jgi:hypothetical protein
MELDCPMYNKVTLLNVDNNKDIIFPIRILREDGNSITLTKYGQFTDADFAKCVIFPKGKTTWEGFQRPFMDGDILVYKHKSNNVKYTFIYKRRIDMHYLLQYCGWFSEKPYLSEQFNTKERVPLYENDDIRFATEKEKQILFDAIRNNGYCWNAETKTLKKLVEPKFKVGDKVKHKCDKNNTVITITCLKQDCYYIQYFNNIKNEYQNEAFLFTDQDEYELVPNKFDFNTLKPFEQVLVRCSNNGRWVPQFFAKFRTGSKFPFECTYNSWIQCVPYKGNEYLYDTTDNCSEFYRIWKDE